MNHIPESLKTQYAQLCHTASATIHRHPQLELADELKMLAGAVGKEDARDSYGLGGTVAQFERQLCSIFDKSSCLFLSTGTLAQCVAMKCYSEHSGRTVIGLHPTSHLLLHEHMAIEKLWGLRSVSIGKAECVVSSHNVSALAPKSTSAIIIELPMREIGGALPAWEELVKIRAWCDEHGVKMHMDGARVWQVAQYYSRSLADIAALFDSLYVSFYKDLGGIFGAALLGEDNLIENARIWARRAGGNPITQYPQVIAARRGLDTYLQRMPDYVGYTKLLCEALRPLPITLLPESPEASMFHLRFALSQEVLAQRIVDYVQKTDVIVLPLPRSGDEHSCVCEITVGENTLAQSYAFWATHIEACLAS